MTRPPEQPSPSLSLSRSLVFSSPSLPPFPPSSEYNLFLPHSSSASAISNGPDPDPVEVTLMHHHLAVSACSVSVVPITSPSLPYTFGAISIALGRQHFHLCSVPFLTATFCNAPLISNGGHQHPTALQHLPKETQLQRCLSPSHPHRQQRSFVQLLQSQGQVQYRGCLTTIDRDIRPMVC